VKREVDGTRTSHQWTFKNKLAHFSPVIITRQIRFCKTNVKKRKFVGFQMEMAEGWISCMDMEPHLMESDIRYLSLQNEMQIFFA
jgi:hypothetical protein